MSAIWITWERQRRNRSMAASVNASLHELEYRGSRLTRYLVLGYKTTRLVLRNKPDIVFYQNPSLILAALIVTLKWLSLTRAKVVGDFHNAGVFPPVARFLVPWLVRNSNLVIVSNKNLERPITKMGGRAISIPDPIPLLPDHATRARSKQFEVFFICSWADDEPICEVLQAANLLSETHPDVTISVTGRPRLAERGWNTMLPKNVQLTGFLSELAFEECLLTAAAVLDLTTRADCMVCGAYEAVSAEVPMILSNNEPTKQYFYKGARYTDNSAHDIAAQIAALKADYQQYKAAISDLKRELLAQDQAAVQHLSMSLSNVVVK